MIFGRAHLALGFFVGAVCLSAAGCGHNRPAPVGDDDGTGGRSVGQTGGRAGAATGGVGGAAGAVTGTGGAAGAKVGTGGTSATGGAAGAKVGTGGTAGSAPGTGGAATGGRASSTGGMGGVAVATGGAAGTPTTGTGGGGPLGGAGGCGTSGMLALVSSTTTRLVDLFVGPEGIIVVQSNQVTLYGRDRQLRRMVPFAREIVSAAMDGNLLVIADRAALTAMSPDLTMGPSVFVSETCVGSVLVSGGRLVCGPSNDWDRVFYTYNMTAVQPALLATSGKYTYNGIPMRRVPGTDDFVTVSDDLSPSDFHLYRAGTDGKVVFINESPYHGDFAATRVYAFDGSPAQHLIQTAGLMLKIYADGCSTMTNSFTSGCFVKDGVLGTLQGQESFVGMADDGASKVYAVASSGGFAFDSPCKNGCSFQRINVGTRTVETQKTYPVTNMNGYARPGMLVAPDPTCARLVVGYATPGTTSSIDVGGFQVQSFDL